MMKYANNVRVEMVRMDTPIHDNWFSRMNGFAPRVVPEYFIRYRSLGYHGIIKVVKTDAGMFRVLLGDGTIIDAHDLKTI